MKKLPIMLFISYLLVSPSCYAQLGEAPMPNLKPASVEASGPTLEETTKWIIEKTKRLNLHPKIDQSGRDYYYYSDVSFNGCEATFIKRIEYYSDGKFNGRISEDFYLVPLAEVDENSVITSHYESKSFWISINSIGKNPVFHKTSGAIISNTNITEAQLLVLLKTIGARPNGFGQGGATEAYSYASFYAPDLEMAERLSKAFKHAVKLCKIKDFEEKQKAAEEKAEKAKAQPKEIF